MFGSENSRTIVVPEPLLDEDIITNTKKSHVLLRLRFRLVLSSTDEADKGGEDADRREAAFDDLKFELFEKKAVPPSFLAMPNVSLVLSVLPAASEKAAALVRSIRSKKKIVKKKEPKSRPPKFTPQEKLFNQFVRATRFVRGEGSSAVHPSAKLRLYGLLMQAQKGNLSEGEMELTEDNLKKRGRELSTEMLGFDLGMRAGQFCACCSTVLVHPAHLQYSLAPHFAHGSSPCNAATEAGRLASRGWPLARGCDEGIPRAAHKSSSKLEGIIPDCWEGQRR